MDRIKCKVCSAESYHEYGKTELCCGECLGRLQAEIECYKVALEKDDILCNAILEEHPKCHDLVKKVKFRYQQKLQALKGEKG